MQDRTICVFGMGYVGLTLALAMAERGFRVIGLEKNERTLGILKSGKSHFYEVGLEVRMARAVQAGTLSFHASSSEAAWTKENAPSVFIITVGTPLGENGPRMDMVEGVAREIGRVMPDDSLVVLRSTVRLGTSRKVVLPILQATGKRFQLAYCPERTIEGRALEELAYLPQIVGGLTDDAAWRAAHMFQHLTSTTVRVSSLEAAEIIKLLDNSYRDVIFALGNEVALLCDAAGLDGIEIINAANMGYERTNIARPGFVGGPCLQKDPHILMDSLRDFSHVPGIIKASRGMNEDLPNHVIKQLLADVPDSSLPKAPVISVCGVAFKGRPETDDTRGTPAKELIEALKARFPSAELRGQDFKVSDEGIRELGLKPVTIDDAFRGANMVIVANNNAKYQWLDVDALVRSMARPGVLFDAWSVLPLGDTREQSGVKIRRLGSATAWRKGS